ncbi:MAG: dethiobiotin synthase [Planctomycetes bacterium]|nr:dethiobiotin synthase [Planctomycetota bacterium]
MGETQHVPQGLFITGTDTGVGKTWITVELVRLLRETGTTVGVVKPVASGAQERDGELVWDDIERLAEMLPPDIGIERVCPQRFRAPLAPPVAARLEHRTVDAALLRSAANWWHGRVDLLLVEGVGGLLCPLTDSETVADLARDLNLPLVIVGRLGLGTINHTLLTFEAAEARGLTVAAIVLNEAEPVADQNLRATNPAEIAARTAGVPVIVVEHGSPAGLRCDHRGRTIDWHAAARA